MKRRRRRIMADNAGKWEGGGAETERERENLIKIDDTRNCNYPETEYMERFYEFCYGIYRSITAADRDKENFNAGGKLTETIRHNCRSLSHSVPCCSFPP